MLFASLLLYAFVITAAADGLYFHLWKYRLHERPETAREHLLHTINACLFLPQPLLLFCFRVDGLWLLLAALSVVATVVVEILDVFEEGRSRASLGGLTSAEYASHFAMSGMRMGFVMALLGQRELGDLANPSTFSSVAWYWQVVGWSTLVPAAAVAALHVWLLYAGRRVMAAGGRRALGVAPT